VEGSHRFLQRVWKLAIQFLEYRGIERPIQPSEMQESERALLRKTHQTIRKVSHDIEHRMHQNTAISAIMELVNEITDFAGHRAIDAQSAAVVRQAVETVIHLLNPFAPHITEELWQLYGHNTMLACSAMPVFDPELARQDTATVVIQVNGKLRGSLEMARGAAQEEVLAAARQEERVKKHFEDKEIRKIIFIPDKIINIVVKD